MRHVKIDAASYRSALVCDHDLLRSLDEIKWLDQRISNEARHTDRPAAFARAKRNLARSHLVISLLHRWDGPGLQDWIGKFGNAVGRLAAAAVGYIGVGLVKSDGTRPSSGRREQIVHAERAVEHPAGVCGRGEIGDHLIFLAVRGQGSAHRVEDAGHYTDQTKFGHRHLLSMPTSAVNLG